MSTQTAQEAPEVPQDGSQEPEDHKPDREAAKYRTRLRETEAERDTLATQRDTLARTIVESHLPGHVSPKLFWQLHQGTDGLIGQDGTVDVDAIAHAAQEMASEYGLTPMATAPVVPDVGKQPETQPTTQWQEVVRGNNVRNEL